MLEVEHKTNFLKKIHKTKDTSVKTQVKNQIKKILENPGIGKPMKYVKKEQESFIQVLLDGLMLI